MSAQHTPDQNATFAFRITALERDVMELRQQLDRYVPVRENDLQLTSIRSTAERIEREVQDTKKQLVEINSKLVVQDTESQKRDVQQRESQSAIQIKVLWGTLSIIIAFLVSILIGYANHFFH